MSHLCLGSEQTAGSVVGSNSPALLPLCHSPDGLLPLRRIIKPSGPALLLSGLPRGSAEGAAPGRRTPPWPAAGFPAARVLISSAIGGSAAGIAGFWRVFGRLSLPVGTPQIGGLLRQSYNSSFWRQGSLLAGSPRRVGGSTTRAGEKSPRCPPRHGAWAPRLTALLSPAPGLRGRGALALAPWRDCWQRSR